MVSKAMKKGSDYQYLKSTYTKMLMTDAESTIVRLERVVSDIEGTLTYGSQQNTIEPNDLLFDEFDIDISRNDIAQLKKSISFLDGMVKRMNDACRQ